MQQMRMNKYAHTISFFSHLLIDFYMTSVFKYKGIRSCYCKFNLLDGSIV